MFRPLGAAQQHRYVVSACTIKEIDLANFPKLPGQPFEIRG